MDGGNRIVGTEFVKLLITGSSDLATEEYVNTKVAEGGGGVQPEDVYTKAEADTLLNNKLNVNNPQDITGNLRLDPTNGLSKIILNAVNAPNDEDFYVNGNGYVNGELRGLNMKCDNILTFATIKGNFISNNDSNTDLKFQINSNDFITLSTANDVIEVDKDIELHSSTLKSDVLDTWSNASLEIRRNGINYISLDADDTISISRQSKISSNKLDGVDMTVSHHNNTTNLFEKKLSFKNGNEIYATGDGGVDEELLLNYYTDAGVRIGNATDAYLTIKGARNGTHTLTVNGTSYFGDDVNCNEDIIMKAGKLIYLDTTTGKNRYVYAFEEGDTSVLSIGNTRLDGTKGQTRFVNSNSTSMIIDSLNVYTPRQFQGDNGIKVDFTDTRNTGANFAFRRNGTEFLRLDATGDNINCSKDIVLSNQNTQFIKFPNCSIREGFATISYFDFINSDTTGNFRFFLGIIDGASLKMNITPTTIDCYNNVVVDTGKSVITNTLNTNGDNDLVFQRNGVEYMRLRDLTNPADVDIIDVANDKGLSTPDLYTNEILNRSWSFDTVYSGSNAGGTARVEYMRWNYTDQSLDFNAPIDNTGLLITGNIVDTTVSDERLKTNIKDVESNYCDCVKNVKIKTFEYTDEKYKNNDKYGFLAQQLQEHLPKEFKNIVKETKSKKDEGETFLSINYMKLSVVLWGGLQEALTKINELENRIIVLEKPKAKPKPKAKSKP